ncbi:MAG TPA: helix-turn-helix domain-containing protein [Devosia sp.]|nr:helix-turn-helix domain-containing protein [Devosia sp.]
MQSSYYPIAQAVQGAPAEARPWACDDVAALVAREKNVPMRLLMHSSRCRAAAARARQLAMYLAHVMLGRSLSEVGHAFGRDRTTVSYACALIEDLREDPDFDAFVTRLEQKIDDQHVLPHWEPRHAGH